MHVSIARTLVAQHQGELAQMAGRGRRGGGRRWRRGRRPQDHQGVFLDGPEGVGIRVYLTARETQRFTGEWSALLAGLARRYGDPGRRPGAVEYEVVVLGRQLRERAEPAGAGTTAR